MSTLGLQNEAQIFADFELQGFDVNAAFQGVLSDVISDKETAAIEKINRMEGIVREGNTEAYRDFIDFRSMAAQIEMFCNHNHINEQLSSSLTNFLETNRLDASDNLERSPEDEEDNKSKSKKRKTIKDIIRLLFQSRN